MGTIQSAIRLHGLQNHRLDGAGAGDIDLDKDGFTAVLVIIWTVCCPPSAFMSAMMSFAPSLANVRAVARPIPEAPPVTNATLPSTRPAMSSPPSLLLRHRRSSTFDAIIR